MKKKMLAVTLILFAGLLVSGTTYYFTKNLALYSLSITFGTIFYHFAMRLAVGYIINNRFHNHIDYTLKWFKERDFEQKFYIWIQIKKWKKWVPVFNPKDYNLKNNSIAEIIQVTCQAEVVHEIIMILSFVPVIFSVWFGANAVFLITSCAAFLIDSIFVVLQRYNRPRLMRLLKDKQLSNNL